MKRILGIVILISFCFGCAGQREIKKAYDDGYKQAVKDFLQYPETFKDAEKVIN